MNEFSAKQAGYAVEGQIKAAVIAQQNLTVGENIDRQIERAMAEVERLQTVKKQLEKSGLLTVSIADLRQAMQY